MTAHALATALAIAFHVWGVPACGHVDAAWADLGPSNLGAATPCVVELNRGRREVFGNWETLCTTVVHEWGHLAGHPHSSDPGNVMYPTAVRYWRCRTRRPHYGFSAQVWRQTAP